MRIRCHPSLILLLAVALGLSSAPRATAQAGLSGNALGGQRDEMMRGTASSPWDKGTQSRSALGQLEEMTGTKVDRSGNQNRYQPAAPVRKSLSTQQLYQQAFNEALAGALADVLLNALFNDNAAAKAKAEAEARAAAAAAAAEAARIAEEARQARIKLAGSLRAKWDAQDQAMSSSLSGAFDVHAGTAFFGRPANPDADDVARLLSATGDPEDTGDAPAVELPDRPGLAVDPAATAMPAGGAGLQAGSGYDAWRPEVEAAPAGFTMPELTPRTAAEEAALHAAGWYGDKMEGAVRDNLLGLAFKPITERLERLPGYSTFEQFHKFQETYEALKHPFDTFLERWKELFTGGATSAALVLGSSRLSDEGLGTAYDREERQLNEDTQRNFQRTAFDQAMDPVIDSSEPGSGSDEEPEFSFSSPLTGITRGHHGHISINR